jgi:hypothetical protein
MTSPDYDLIWFVRHLHAANSDIYGLMSLAEKDRVARWLDAVLPPPPPKETKQIPFLG